VRRLLEAGKIPIYPAEVKACADICLCTGFIGLRHARDASLNNRSIIDKFSPGGQSKFRSYCDRTHIWPGHVYAQALAEHKGETHGSIQLAYRRPDDTWRHDDGRFEPGDGRGVGGMFPSGCGTVE
jgi:hypothetical protein